MTDNGLPQYLQKALSMIERDMDGWVSRSNLRELQKRGLIVAHEEKVYEADGTMLPVTVTKYTIRT